MYIDRIDRTCIDKMWVVMIDRKQIYRSGIFTFRAMHYSLEKRRGSTMWSFIIIIIIIISKHGRVDDFSLFDCLSPFCFSCELNFTVLFHSFIFYYYILVRYSDKLVCCLFYCLSQGISHGMWFFAWGGVDAFSFSIAQVHFVLVN